MLLRLKQRTISLEKTNDPRAECRHEILKIKIEIDKTEIKIREKSVYLRTVCARRNVRVSIRFARRQIDCAREVIKKRSELGHRIVFDREIAQISICSKILLSFLNDMLGFKIFRDNLKIHSNNNDMILKIIFKLAKQYTSFMVFKIASKFICDKFSAG